MKFKMLSIVILQSLLGVLFFCGDDSSNDNKDTGVAPELIGQWELVSPTTASKYLVAKADSLWIASQVYSPVTAADGQIYSTTAGAYYYDYTYSNDSLYLIAEATATATNPAAATPGVMLLTKNNTIIGSWAQTIVATPPLIPKDLVIGINIIKADSSFLIYVKETTPKELFNHEGTWEIIGDSVYLTGTFCEMLDTTADPDTLMPMPDSLCQQLMKIDTSRTSDDIWNVRVGQLGPVIESFPLDESMISIIKGMNLDLRRQ